MADISKTVAIVFKGQDETGTAIANVESGLIGIEKNANVAKNSLANVSDQVEKLGKTEAVNKASVALQAFAASLVVKEFVEANKAFEQVNLTLKSTTGSAAAAKAEFEFIREASNRLGLETRSTAEAYANFAAATKGTALEGQGARDIFVAFAGTMSALGKSSSDVQGALVQLAQGISKGKFELEDLKSIAERVPGFFDKFATSLGVTREQIFAMVSAGQIGGDEIAQFAKSLNESLGNVEFEGFNASIARFRNALDDVYLQLGKAGAFDLLTKGVQAGTAAVTGAISAFTAFGEIVGNALSRFLNGDFKGFGADVDAALQNAANKTRSARDALLGYTDDLKGAGKAGEEAGGQVSGGMSEAEKAARQSKEETAALDKALRALNVNPKQIKEPLLDVVKAFEDIARNPAVNGSQLFAGFEAALKKAKSLEELGGLGSELVTAFGKGKLSSDEFRKATELLATAQDKVQKSLEKSSDSGKKQEDALKKQAEAAEKAQEKARQYALELEKLASNERIKLIEARVAINVAQIEADTKRVQAAFESINKGIESTEKIISGVISSFKDIPSEFDPRFKALKTQLEKENTFREQQFKLQKELTTAQIEQMRAQTKAMERGDALIKIDGAGLQPHLEAFMWEILKTIQVRVNQDGLKMLLGV